MTVSACSCGHHVNLIFTLNLSDKRTTENTINLINNAIKKLNYLLFFYIECEIKYANNYLKNFLEKYNCQQSISTKRCH